MTINNSRQQSIAAIRPGFKYYITIYLFLTTVISLSLKGQQTAIALDKMDVLYMGVENPITVAASNCSCNELFISTSNGILKGSGCKYTLLPGQVGSATIQVFKKIKTGLKKISSSEFRVKMLPFPVLKIGPWSYSGTPIKKEILLRFDYVKVGFVPEIDMDAGYKVDSFHVKIIQDSLTIVDVVNIGNKLNDKVKKAFIDLKTGDIVIIEKIHVHTAVISPTLRGFYMSRDYDPEGNVIYKLEKSKNSENLELELDPIGFTIYQ